MAMRVGVKFCGNCNPKVDLVAVFHKMKTMTDQMEFVFYNDPGGFDKLLILSACSADCATRPDFAGPTVVVAGGEVDYWAASFAQMPDVILDALLKK